MIWMTRDISHDEELVFMKLVVFEVVSDPSFEYMDALSVCRLNI
jgi:hypothetical protein